MIKDECIYFCGPYKGYGGRASLEDDLFHGEVIGLRDVVTFQGRTPAELRKAFADSVDDYLEFCAQRGEEPTKPFSGKFMARIPAEVHRKLSENADKAGKSMNQYLVDLLTVLVDASPILARSLATARQTAKGPTAKPPKSPRKPPRGRKQRA